MAMTLHDLIEGLALQVVQGDSRQHVAELTDDSRQVQPGWLFLARTGTQTDGRRFIGDAIARGAAAIICEAGPESAAGIDGAEAVVWVKAQRLDTAAVSELAGRFFSHPSRRLKLIGVTGTNGKTTTCYIIHHLLAAADVKAGLIGTVQIDDGAHRRAAELTTPGAVEFQRLLATMVDNGCAATVAEVSSHALHQGRTAALQFHAGLFTNLTGDHLDYHGNMDEYAVAKALLFEQLPADAWAVVNADDPYAERMVRDATVDRSRLIRCTLKPACGDAEADNHDCRATIMEMSPGGSMVRFDGPWGSREVRLPLVGRHNVQNALHALAAANTVISLSRSLRASMEHCPSVPGRLEPVNVAGGEGVLPVVLVDYAHTHDALQNVLEALRPVTPGRLIVLFGCGGDRDRTKRPRMAQVACALADHVVITSDNPRTEDPAAIIDEILAGVPADRQDAIAIQPDRRSAIAQAIAMAAADDVVLLAGKGHEDYQIIGTEKHHFDDREEAAAALLKRMEPQMNTDEHR